MTEGEIRLMWFVIPACALCVVAIGFALGMGHYGKDGGGHG